MGLQCSRCAESGTLERQLKWKGEETGLERLFMWFQSCSLQDVSTGSQGPTCWSDHSPVPTEGCRVSSPGESTLVLLPTVEGVLQGRGRVREWQRHAHKFLLFDKKLGRMAVG